MIDVIGIGNHEETWIRKCNTDPVRLLIERLNAQLAIGGSDHSILHGGIAGYYVTTFRFARDNGASSGVMHKLLYMHGSGGDAPVTKGTINVNRKSVAFTYDAFTFGHIHNSLILDDVVMDVTPKGNLIKRQRVVVIPGSYYRNYMPTNQANPADYSYAESKQHPEKPLGGKFLILTPEREHRTRNGKNTSVWHVRQDVLTSLDRSPVKVPA